MSLQKSGFCVQQNWTLLHAEFGKFVLEVKHEPLRSSSRVIVYILGNMDTAQDLEA